MSRNPLFSRSLIIGLLLIAGGKDALAQELIRDPTVAPSDKRTAAPLPPGMEGMAVLVRNDKPYLMVGTRLYAVGDRVGKLRVDRITEKEVWFHDGANQIKIPRFTGIERKTAAGTAHCAAASSGAPLAAASAPAKGKSKRRVNAPPVGNAAPSPASCEDAQP